MGDDLIERAKSIASPLNIMILVSLTCTMCPETVLASQRIASLNPAVRAEAYDVAHFPELRDHYGAMSVPCIVITRADGTQRSSSARRAFRRCSNWSARNRDLFRLAAGRSCNAGGEVSARYRSIYENASAAEPVHHSSRGRLIKDF